MKSHHTEDELWMPENGDAPATEPVADTEDDQRLGMSMLAKIAVGVFVVVALIISVANVMEFNKQQEQIEALKAQNEEMEKEIGEKQNLLDSPVDDAYIAALAEKLGLSYPDEKHYYNDLND